MNTIVKFAGAAFIGSMMLAAPANAALISVAGACGSLSGPTELNGSFNCTRFDSTIGTLASMTLTITGQIGGTITLSNGGGTAASFAGTTQSQFYIGALPGFTLSSPLFTASMGTGLQSIAGGASTVFGPLSGSANSGAMVNTTNFTGYQAPGGGVFGIGAQTLTGLLISGGGGQAGGSQSTTGVASATVSYLYDDGVVTTPEPASMALLGAGMLALGVARRRRRS